MHYLNLIRPYLYHTIITDLETGEIFHYFGKSNGNYKNYVGSGTFVTKMKHNPRYEIECIKCVFFETHRECWEAEPGWIQAGLKQWGDKCKNIMCTSMKNPEKASYPKLTPSVYEVLIGRGVTHDDFDRILEEENYNLNGVTGRFYSSEWNTRLSKEDANKYGRAYEHPIIVFSNCFSLEELGIDTSVLSESRYEKEELKRWRTMFPEIAKSIMSDKKLRK